jgi:uncharacterized protein YcbX
MDNQNLPFKSTYFDDVLVNFRPSVFSLIVIWATVLTIVAAITLAVALIILPDYGNAKPQPRGCRRLGLEGKSNIADEHEVHPEKNTKNEGASRWRVKSLWVYPVKSCRGVEVDSSTVVETGMKFDRQFCFAQFNSSSRPNSFSKQGKLTHTWKFITQRNFPLLAQVKAEIWMPDPTLASYDPRHPDVQNGGVIILSFPDQAGGLGGIVKKLATLLWSETPEEYISIPFNPTADYIKKEGFEEEEVIIWKDSPKAINMAPVLPLKFKRFLGVPNPLALFRVSEKHRREVSRCAPRKEEIGYQPLVGFADSYPLHILNITSVRDIASKVDKSAPKLSVLQFRANIIVEGPLQYAEDEWKRIRIGGAEYHVSCGTARCKMPNSDQITGVKHATEPDKTLRSFRRVDPGVPYDGCLGMQMVPALKKSIIRVGDMLEVLAKGEHHYIK